MLCLMYTVLAAINSDEYLHLVLLFTFLCWCSVHAMVNYNSVCYTRYILLPLSLWIHQYICIIMIFVHLLGQVRMVWSSFGLKNHHVDNRHLNTQPVSVPVW